ncbi:MAG TPA: S8 family serine peptidase [Anaerolineales bacterium]|nr:S8 family serine peptidase [Anaerolineales bacterium]
MIKTHKPVAFLLFLFLLLAAFGLQTQPVQAVDLLDHEVDQVVVRVAPGGDIGEVNAVYGTTVLDTIPGQPDIYLLQAPPGANLLDLVVTLAGDPQLLYAELNYLTADPEDGSTNRIYGWGDGETFKTQQFGSRINLAAAHGYGLGAGTVVAVLDTGIQVDHPEFSGVISPLGFDFVDGDPDPSEEADGIDDDLDGQIDEGYGHGTHVAGIVHLVAPEATLLPLRVLNSDARGNTFKVAAAVFYAAANGADVINMSLGSAGRSILLSEAVAEAAALGSVVVAAAGNTDSSLEQYPAAESCALAVSSVRTDNNKKSSFSSYGSWIGLAAPGDKIVSTFPIDGYASTSGTSMAAPFVAGQVALLKSLAPDLTLGEIGALLGGTVQPVNDTLYPGLLGEGLIDILASLEALVSSSGFDPGSNVFASCAGS